MRGLVKKILKEFPILAFSSTVLKLSSSSRMFVTLRIFMPLKSRTIS